MGREDSRGGTIEQQRLAQIKEKWQAELQAKIEVCGTLGQVKAILERARDQIGIVYFTCEYPGGENPTRVYEISQLLTIIEELEFGDITEEKQLPRIIRRFFTPIRAEWSSPRPAVGREVQTKVTWMRCRNQYGDVVEIPSALGQSLGVIPNVGDIKLGQVLADNFLTEQQLATIDLRSLIEDQGYLWLGYSSLKTGVVILKLQGADANKIREMMGLNSRSRTSEKIRRSILGNS